MIKPLLFLIAIAIASAASAFGQSFRSDIMRDSARSDKLTGGRIERTAIEPGRGDLKITINVPAFRMTLWQGSREIKTYPIGVGMAEWPIFIGLREASSIEWNPVWIPPSSDWIDAGSSVKPGEVILPTDRRNPLGKVKVPLGYGYLIHQAKGPGDMGSLVSHGCVRVMQADLYDLTEKIVAGRGLDVTPAQIASAKRTKKTLVVPLEPIIPVEITYDTLVVESGRLHIYPDVYSHRKNTVANLREELKTSGFDDSKLSDATLKRMLAAATGKKQFTVKIADLESGEPKGQVIAVLANPSETRPPIKAKTPIRKGKWVVIR
jgi:hypothetical protein